MAIYEGDRQKVLKRVDLRALETVASAAYRRQGSDRATLHEKWQRIEFGHVDARSDDPAVLVRLPDRVVEKACGGRPCWRFESPASP